MKNPLARLFENLAALFGRIFGSKKPALRCTFCNATDHATDDCPNAAKYKLFNVERD